MLTPRLSPPFLTQDILSIPDMMQHSPLFQPWIKKVKKKKKRLSSGPLGFSAWSRETSMQPGEGWRDNSAAHCSVKSLIVSCPEWIRPPSGLVKGCVLWWAVESVYPRTWDLSCTVFTVLRNWFKALCLHNLAFCLATWSDPSGVF